MEQEKSERWPIERSWFVQGEDVEPVVLKTEELLRLRACVLLGSAGLGKTVELRHMARLAQSRGLDVREERLIDLSLAGDLDARLRRFAEGATESTVIFLDALDEVMIPVKTAGRIIAEWISNTLKDSKPTLRIACRSAVLPGDIGTAIASAYGKDQFRQAQLQPLSADNIRAIAQHAHVEPAQFIAAVTKARAERLAAQPLTLLLLLRIFGESRALPGRRSALFAKGIARLVMESRARHDAGATLDVSQNELIDAAERLACYTLFSGAETIDIADIPQPGSLTAVELAALPGNVHLDDRILRALRFSGLCEGEGTYRFRFAHRQLAEYLAGRRLATALPFTKPAACSHRDLGGAKVWLDHYGKSPRLLRWSQRNSPNGSLSAIRRSWVSPMWPTISFDVALPLTCYADSKSMSLQTP